MPADDASSQSHRFSTLPLFQREVALVLVLCAVSVGLFAATRSIANWERATQVRNAAAWYERGSRGLAAGSTDEGVAYLRRAVGGDRGNPVYTLALARALAGTGHDDEASRLLLRLRELHPDDSEINLRLARLSARAGNKEAAVRYYNHAIYGLATLDNPRDPRPIRQELARYLLNEGDRDAALTELGALSREISNDPASHLEIATLFERAGDLRQARAQYEAAAALDPRSWTALVGAGEASFAMDDYAEAAQDLAAAARVGSLSDRQRQHLETAQRIQAVDPLATGLAMNQRITRFSAGLQHVKERLAGCASPAANGASQAAADPLGKELDEFASRPRTTLRDSDVLTSGVELLARASAEAERRCGAHDPTDEAWIRIGRMHRETGRE